MDKVEKPWGSYEVIAEGHGFLVKILNVKKGERLSVQRHKYRAENWVILSGGGLLTLDKALRVVDMNSTIHIEPGIWHSIEALIDLVILETQIGSILSENDIERSRDKYGRA